MNESVSLQAVLANKEARQLRQKEMLYRYEVPIISMHVNMPGAIKLTDSSVFIHDTMLKVLKKSTLAKRWQIVEVSSTAQITGVESIVCVDADAKEIKKLCCELEEEHPLGRFIDMDVIDTDAKILSRKSLAKGLRKCYICDKPAVECGRSRRHEIQELVAHINESVQAYRDGN